MRSFLLTTTTRAMSIGLVVLLTSCGGGHTMTPQIPTVSNEQSQLRTLGTAQGHVRYRLVDIGTFGGPESAIGIGVEGGLNNAGIAVGFSATSIPTTSTSNPFLCGGPDFVTPFVTHAFEWDGSVKDLGSLGGAAYCSLPFALNANGEIVGFSENGVIDALSGLNETRAVRWENGQIEDLGSLGGNQNVASSINDRGQVVGNSENKVADPFSIFGFGTQVRAALWQHGQVQDLGTLGGPDALADFINARGQIAGASYINSIANPATGVPQANPFFWQDGRMLDIGSFGGSGIPSNWKGLNNRGEVIGGSAIAADPIACLAEHGFPLCLPFLWHDGKLIDLSKNTARGEPETANAINDAGDIVGTAIFPNDATQQPYIRRHGVATDLGTVNDDCFGEAFGINSRDQAVGQAFACDTGDFRDAFLWENGCIVDLNTLIPANSSLHIVTALYINDRGEIVGTGVPRGTSPATVFTTGHAYVLVPTGATASGATHAQSEQCSSARAKPASTAKFHAPPSNSAAARRAWTAGLRSWARFRSH